jgi:hypothetical protein
MAFLLWIGRGGILDGPFPRSLRAAFLMVERSVMAFLMPSGAIGTWSGPFSGGLSVPFPSTGGSGLTVLVILPFLLGPRPMPGLVVPFPRGTLGMVRST